MILLSARRYMDFLHGVVIACFFYQAEDGIRDWSVTGVQTCALPIWRTIWRLTGSLSAVVAFPAKTRARSRTSCRSEERRVGKERRFGGASGASKSKTCRDRPPVMNPGCIDIDDVVAAVPDPYCHITS